MSEVELKPEPTSLEVANELRQSMKSCPFCGTKDPETLYAGMWNDDEGGTFTDRMAAGCRACDVFVMGMEGDSYPGALELMRRAVTKWNTRTVPVSN